MSRSFYKLTIGEKYRSLVVRNQVYSYCRRQFGDCVYLQIDDVTYFSRPDIEKTEWLFVHGFNSDQLFIRSNENLMLFQLMFADIVDKVEEVEESPQAPPAIL